ncbi:hypothetical protein ABKY47_002078 [Aeromonas hydrophila]
MLKTIGLRRRSKADRVNRMVLSGYKPSAMARVLVGWASSRKINELWAASVDMHEKNKRCMELNDGQ